MMPDAIDTINTDPKRGTADHRRVEKVTGVSLNLYIKPKNRPYYDGIKRMTQGEGSSFSKVFNNTIQDMYHSMSANVAISPMAYKAIAAEDLMSLRTRKHRDGVTELLVDKELEAPDAADRYALEGALQRQRLGLDDVTEPVPDVLPQDDVYCPEI